MFCIRLLTLDDLDQADQVLISAFQGGSRRAELERFLHLENSTWLAGETDGRVIGMVGAVDYGSFAYIGLMGVHADYRRHGYARQLMSAIIAHLATAGQECTLLDASPQGAPLYEQLGYEDLSLAHAYRLETSRNLAAPGQQYAPDGMVEPLEFRHLDEILMLEAPVFGARREAVLAMLLRLHVGRVLGWRASAGWLAGYLIAQNNRIGPWMAQDPGMAAALLNAALQFDYDFPISIIVPSPNQAACQVVQAAGFERQHSLRHMRRGRPAPGRGLEHMYAQASFMLG